jgi:formamidopyrimidine-DNA glycosylase
MPELPEVETIVRSLKPLVIGRQITGVEFRGSGLRDSVQPGVLRILANPAREFRRRICGAFIEGVERYGKNIVFQLRHGAKQNGRLFFLVHLGMTGRLTCESTPDFRGKHTHLILSLDGVSNGRGRWLHYSDTRRFGRLRVTSRLQEELSELGPDPLEISGEEFFGLLRSRRVMLKSLLLNQRFLRGIGNIYADESLFRAGIHPTTPAARLSRKRADRLYHGIRETLFQAIEQGGSSISDYVDGRGRRGSFQRLHRVYRRTGEPCLRCGSRIRKIVVSSRSTHFCPRCQKQ